MCAVARCRITTSAGMCRRILVNPGSSDTPVRHSRSTLLFDTPGPVDVRLCPTADQAVTPNVSFSAVSAMAVSSSLTTTLTLISLVLTICTLIWLSASV